MAVDTMDPAQAFEAKMLEPMKSLNDFTARGTSAVQQFYSGATVFLTGGSGFLGKQLIEKLLRATEISKIFILLRSKKGKSIEQRLIEMLEDPLYKLLRAQRPNFEEKIMPVSGDAAELRLGLSEKDWDTITEQVDFVFHLAATTRFDETLRVATLINIRGTREALTLGKACKKLRSFVYVSTAYSHACADRVDTEIFEKFYKSTINPSTMIGIAESVDEGRINDITPSLTKNWPNTYTFAKSVAEQLVTTHGKGLPICVVRPAIVVPTKLEPNPGWLDMSCVFGASGLVMAVGLGLMHTVPVADDVHLDLVPVDYVNNVIIAAGWETAKKQGKEKNETKIYVVSPSRNSITWRKLEENLRKDGKKYVSPKIAGYTFAWCTKNPILFWIYSWLLHLIPAYIADGLTVLLGKERRFAKLATKMYKMSAALSYFLLNQWHFDDRNTAELFNSLSKDDRFIFNFDMREIDWYDFLMTWVIGLRKYVVKDGLTGTAVGQRKLKIFGIIAYIIFPLYLYCLFKVGYFALSLLLLLKPLF